MEIKITRRSLNMSVIKDIVKNAEDRYQLWSDFINKNNCATACEIGVYKGDFAQVMLERCTGIQSYYMVDPWRNLSDWNKPANTDNEEFERYFNQTMDKTEFAKEKRHILRGKTTEVVQDIKDQSLDFAYIDGDHTLKGITIDLSCIWSKVKPGGFIAGDDFCSTIWQHYDDYEPTLVFPYAVYFAEAMQTKIIALPFDQFLISKEENGFEFIDLTKGKYKTRDLKDLINLPKKEKPKESVIKKIKNKFN